MINAESIIAEFNEHQAALNMATATIEWRDVQLWRFFSFLTEEGVKQLAEVNQKVILKYQLHLNGLKNKKGEDYEPSVLNAHVTSVRKLFQYLRFKGEVFHDPTAGIELARVPDKLPKDILSQAEIIKLLKQPDTKKWLGLRDRTIMEVLYSTGIRRSELLNIDLNDLYADQGTIHIREGKYSKDRIVPCGKVAWRWLRKYIKEARPFHLMNPDEQAVFISQKGGRLSTQALKNLVDLHAKHAGFNHVTPHIFRHCCATHLSENGADISVIQELLGHEHTDSTAIYLRVAITRLKKIHKECHPREQMKGKTVVKKTA